MIRLVRGFKEQKWAEQFLRGDIYMNTLGYFWNEGNAEQQDFLEPDGHSHSAVQPKMRDHKMIGMRVAICRKSRLCIQLMRMVSLNGA